MFIPSVLWSLDKSQVQPEMAESQNSAFQAEFDAAKEAISGLGTMEQEIASAAEKLQPQNMEPRHSEKPQTGSGLEELLRAITKFEKSNQSRVVDVFE
jgi:hypothetical protein